MFLASFFSNIVTMFQNNYDLFFYGLRMTLILAFVGTGVGLLIALVLAYVKVQEITTSQRFKAFLQRILQGFAYGYVGFFRGTPMIVQAMLFYYGMQRMGFDIRVLTAGLIVVSLNTAAYLTEVIRSGLNALDKGQKEAGLSLGLSMRQVYLLILYPQALKNMIPAIGNELVVNIKDTAVLSVIGVSELFYMGRRVGSASYLFTEAFIIVSVMYLVIVSIAMTMLHRLGNGNPRKRERVMP